MFGVKILVNAFKSLKISACFLAYAAHNCKALRFNEYLAFFAFLRAHFLSEIVICSEEPFTVKAVFHNIVLHLVDFSLSLISFSVIAQMSAKINIVRTGICKQCGNHYRFSNLAVLVLAVLRRSRCLEGFTRL